MARMYAPPIEEARDLANLRGIIFTFVGEWGRLDITYKEYLAHEKLRACINDQTRYRMFVGRTIFSYSMNFLKSNSVVREQLKALEHEKIENPLRFFAPSGDQSLQFLNNTTDDIVILTACNRFGKTQNGVVKLLINTTPCDPSWEIFSKYNVTHIPFLSGRKAGISSYEMSSHSATILPMMLDWCPLEQLGKYAKNYKGKGGKTVSLRTGISAILPLTCGSEYKFLACSQGQGPYESDVREFWLWDEQGEEAKFDGADERARTTLSGGRHYMPMTPHKVEGRPDTGGGSWISKLWESDVAKGRSIAKYKGNVWDVPDWIYPESSKVKAYAKWVEEPAAQQNDKVRREGLSRFFGDWHESSGLVIDEWDSSKHVIEPFDIPKHWTWYRGVDHGITHPAAALQCAVSPAGDMFICKDWLRVGLVVSQIVKEIIEWSGNSRKKIGTYMNPKTDMSYDKYLETFHGRKFQWTVFDPRAWSAKQNESGMLLHKIYEVHGLKMKKGSGKPCEHYIPLMKEWFVIDPEKPHFVTGELGAPRIYVFNTCGDFIRTIKRWVWSSRKTRSESARDKESPTKIDDDLMDVLKYIIQANPKFRGNVQQADSEYYDGLGDYDDEEQESSFKPLNSITGY